MDVQVDGRFIEGALSGRHKVLLIIRMFLHMLKSLFVSTQALSINEGMDKMTELQLSIQLVGVKPPLEKVSDTKLMPNSLLLLILNSPH